MCAGAGTSTSSHNDAGTSTHTKEIFCLAGILCWVAIESCHVMFHNFFALDGKFVPSLPSGMRLP